MNAAFYFKRFATASTAGIVTVYTNHCTRVTTSILLNEAGFGENDIMHVTGHTSNSRLSHYINKASHVKKIADTISNVFSAGHSIVSPWLHLVLQQSLYTLLILSNFP